MKRSGDIAAHLRGLDPTNRRDGTLCPERENATIPREPASLVFKHGYLNLVTGLTPLPYHDSPGYNPVLASDDSGESTVSSFDSDRGVLGGQPGGSRGGHVADPIDSRSRGSRRGRCAVSLHGIALSGPMHAIYSHDLGRVFAKFGDVRG